MSRDLPGERGRNPNQPLLVSKRTGAARAPQPGPVARVEEHHRKSVRKAMATPFSQTRRPQSSFTLVAPLRTRTALPSKAGPLLPSYMVAEERRGKETRRENNEYSLGPTRSAARATLPSMSVQRRVAQSPRKVQQAFQSPSSKRISARLPALDTAPNARVHVGRGGKLVFGMSDSESTSSSEDDRDRYVVHAQYWLSDQSLKLS